MKLHIIPYTRRYFMKKFLPYITIIIIMLILMVCIPLIIGTVAGSINDNSEDSTEEETLTKIATPKTVTVWISESETTKKVDFEDYVTRVVASEMPSSFGEEALKAQSVAARTYVMAKIIKYEDNKPESHPDAPVCDTTHCQVYKTEKDLIASHGDGWEEDGWVKIKKACEETKGELLYYQGELVMQPLFFSSSGGQTENSEDVFSGAYPYLVSVSSPYEENASHSNEEKVFTIVEVQSAMNSTYQDRKTGNLSKDNIEILSYTAGGRVSTIQMGQSTYKGTEVRSALGLSSSLFDITYRTENGVEKIVFTSSGYGHGVGLSQYGAAGMAEKGSNYRDILTHYYSGTEVY
jgi:stage II sporulation protein D